jgi:conjugative transfer region protein TrbK
MASEGAMEGAWPARIGAIVFVALAITAAAIEATRKERMPPLARPAPALEAAADPLRDEQRRCQLMGQAAAADDACLRVWAETRERFLTGVAPRPADQGR